MSVRNLGHRSKISLDVLTMALSIVQVMIDFY